MLFNGGLNKLGAIWKGEWRGHIVTRRHGYNCDVNDFLSLQNDLKKKKSRIVELETSDGELIKSTTERGSIYMVLPKQMRLCAITFGGVTDLWKWDEIVLPVFSKSRHHDAFSTSCAFWEAAIINYIT
ncbi:hypothetical protein QQG55_39585 [Brugia pahangi]|uniref:PH domain-containing protein n=1 Tax=Brugia pahangi TaxID=6280 RepID=A0A0N4SX60_BRUPA|nr:unnamed protein product [Brugia pahangi]